MTFEQKEKSQHEPTPILGAYYNLAIDILSFLPSKITL